MDVILHVGAHRTGTTTLQKTLGQNKDRLALNKVAFCGPKLTRPVLFDGLIKAADRVGPNEVSRARVSTARIGTQMEELRAAGTRSLIVTEENMIGAIPACVASGQLYPDAARRMARFRPAFAGSCTRIAMSIRSYDHHWASMLGFTVKRSGRVPDLDHRDVLVQQPRRWRDVIRELTVVFPNAQVLVWPFEALVDVPQLTIAAMTGHDLPVPLEAAGAVHNPSPDVATLRALVADGASPQHERRLDAGQTGPWRPFTDAQSAKMQADYAEDIDWLRTNPGRAITYIESSEDIAALTEQERGVRDDERQRRVG